MNSGRPGCLGPLRFDDLENHDAPGFHAEFERLVGGLLVHLECRVRADAGRAIGRRVGQDLVLTGRDAEQELAIGVRDAVPLGPAVPRDAETLTFRAGRPESAKTVRTAICRAEWRVTFNSPVATGGRSFPTD